MKTTSKLCAEGLTPKRYRIAPLSAVRVKINVEPCESTLRYKVKALYLKGAFWYFAKQLRKVD